MFRGEHLGPIANCYRQKARGEIHSKIGGRESQPARENYQKCLDILQDLDAKKLLSEVDLKFLERTRAALKPVG